MALTEQQDIPNKPVVNEPWTFKRLFPFAGTISTITKVFINPFDVMLGYLVFIIGIAEVFGRHISWFLYVFTILILLTDVWVRYARSSTETKVEEKKK